MTTSDNTASSKITATFRTGLVLLRGFHPAPGVIADRLSKDNASTNAKTTASTPRYRLLCARRERRSETRCEYTYPTSKSTQKYQHAGGPVRGRIPELRQDVLAYDQLHLEQQKCAEK
jgi:hypothetical protein